MSRDSFVVRVGKDGLDELAKLLEDKGIGLKQGEVRPYVDAALRYYISGVKQGRVSLRTVLADEISVTCRECGWTWSTSQEGFVHCPKGHISGWKRTGPNLVQVRTRARNPSGGKS